MFSKELKELRLEKGLTQKSLSELLEVPKRTIESWESGDRKPPEYVKKLIIEKLNSKKKPKQST